MGKCFCSSFVEDQIRHIGTVRVHSSLDKLETKETAVHSLYLAVQFVLVHRKVGTQIYYRADSLHILYLHEGIQIDADAVCGSSQLIGGILFGLYLLKSLTGWEQEIKSHAQQNKRCNAATGYCLEGDLTDTCPCDFCGTV